ncbi:MAG: rod shape-determining protein, partial [Candidatus Omnitrophica bacterium]|nr:rod shape-determining protein [Candidatus Omnitrophota bacterium]
LEFVRYIPVGSGNITEAMTGSLTLENGSMELTKDEAEKLKMRLGISYEDEIVDKGITSRQILSLMRSTLERLSKEIKRSMDYYTQEYGAEPISAVYLIGGGALLKNLDRFLSEELNIQVKLLELPRSVDISKAHLNNKDSASLIPLISAVLGYKKCLNLLPHEYRQEKIEFIEKISLRMIAIIMGLILLASFLFIKFRAEDYKNRLKNATLQKTILDQIKDLQDRVVERSAFLSQARMSDIPLEYIMKELSIIIPPNVVLNSLGVNQKSKTLDVKGIIYEPRGLAEGILTKFMEAMERSRYFKDAQLASVQDATIGREPSSSFEMSCLLE